MKITWKKPTLTSNFLTKSFVEEIGVEDPARTAFFEKFAHIPIPSIKNTTPKEELIGLLQLAAEVEHALLVQYLYAAYTIPDETFLLRKILINIAIQEMGHLLAVQNLILSIGGVENAHLHKSQLRLTSGESLLPFTLEPVSEIVLAKYVAVEAPIDVPEQFKQRVKEIHKMAKDEAGIEFTPVGGLYMKIFWLFQPNDNPVTELMPLFPNDRLKPGRHIDDSDFSTADDIQKFEADYATWNLSGGGSLDKNKLNISDVFYHVRDRREALKLVHGISAQGEGADFGVIDSHFERFLDEFDKFVQSPPQVIDAPVNPASSANTEFKDPTLIENNYTLLWISLMNKLYTSLLLDIYSSMFYFELSSEDKDRYLRLVFGNMNFLLSTLIKILFRLPRNDDGFSFDTPPLAGPTFEIDGSFRLPRTKQELDDLNNELIAMIVKEAETIQAHTDFPAHQAADVDGNAAGIFFNIQDYIDEKRSLIDPMI